MNKLIAIAFICLFAGNAQASKARVQSLLGAVHLVDSQTIFAHPEYVNELGQYLTLEMGPTGTGTSASSTQAEGGLFRKTDDATYGLYLGHHDTFQNTVRSFATVPVQTNPLNFFYGKGNWGATVGISNTDTQSTTGKETSLYGAFGMDHGDLNWGAQLHLLGSAQTGTGAAETKYTGIPFLGVDVLKEAGDWVLNGNLSYGATKTETAGVSTNRKDTVLQLGGLDRGLKNADRDFYWGASVAYSDRDIEGRHLTLLQLPVVVGLEYNLTSYAVFRGSLRQNFLLGSLKTDAAAPATTSTTDTVPNNTVVAAGLGLKHNNLTLDGTLSAATTGNVNGAAVLANAGLTYNF